MTVSMEISAFGARRCARATPIFPAAIVGMRVTRALQFTPDQARLLLAGDRSSGGGRANLSKSLRTSSVNGFGLRQSAQCRLTADFRLI
jgi:hypothetical protein